MHLKYLTIICISSVTAVFAHTQTGHMFDSTVNQHSLDLTNVLKSPDIFRSRFKNELTILKNEFCFSSKDSVFFSASSLMEVKKSITDLDNFISNGDTTIKLDFDLDNLVFCKSLGEMGWEKPSTAYIKTQKGCTRIFLTTIDKTTSFSISDTNITDHDTTIDRSEYHIDSDDLFSGGNVTTVRGIDGSYSVVSHSTVELVIKTISEITPNYIEFSGTTTRLCAMPSRVDTVVYRCGNVFFAKGVMVRGIRVTNFINKRRYGLNIPRKDIDTIASTPNQFTAPNDLYRLILINEFLNNNSVKIKTSQNGIRIYRNEIDCINDTTSEVLSF